MGGGGGSTEGGGAPGVKGGRRSELEKNLHFSSLMVEAGRRPRRWLEAAKKALRLSLLHERVPSAEKQLAKDEGQTPFLSFEDSSAQSLKRLAFCYVNVCGHRLCPSCHLKASASPCAACFP